MALTQLTNGEQILFISNFSWFFLRAPSLALYSRRCPLCQVSHSLHHPMTKQCHHLSSTGSAHRHCHMLCQSHDNPGVRPPERETRFIYKEISIIQTFKTKKIKQKHKLMQVYILFVVPYLQYYSYYYIIT